MHAWNLEVRVYFATQHPDKKLLAEAQAQTRSPAPTFRLRAALCVRSLASTVKRARIIWTSPTAIRAVRWRATVKRP